MADKRELAKRVAAASGVPAVKVMRVLTEAAGVIVEITRTGGTVRWAELGLFYPKNVQGRTFIDPRTKAVRHSQPKKRLALRTKSRLE